MSVRIDCPTCAVASPLNIALGVVGMKKSSFSDYYEAGANEYFNAGWLVGVERTVLDIPNVHTEDGPVNTLMYLVGTLAGDIASETDWMTPHCKTGEHDAPEVLPVTGADTDVSEEMKVLILTMVESGFATDDHGSVEHGGSYFAMMEAPSDADMGVDEVHPDDREPRSEFDMYAWGYEVNTYGQKAFYKFTTNEDAREWLSAMEV